MCSLRELFIVAAVVVTGTVAGSPATLQERCDASAYAACFHVHGRYTVYTGDGQIVLWPVGTHRLFSVVFGDDRVDKVLSGGSDNNFPQAANEYEVYGDFEVCPLQKGLPGLRRDVCIKKAENLRRVRRKAR